MPSRPNYDRPFDLCIEKYDFVSWDVLGYSGYLYHACLPAVAESYLRAGQVVPRSNVDFKTPRGGLKSMRSFWATLNDYSEGFEFGPVAFRWPTPVALSNTYWMVIRREDSRERFFFVECKKELWDKAQNRLTAADLFDLRGRDPALRSNSTYNFIMRSPLSAKFGDVVVSGVAHRGHTDLSRGRKITRELGERLFLDWLRIQPEAVAMLESFPDLVGHKVRLFVDPPLDDTLGDVGEDPFDDLT